MLYGKNYTDLAPLIAIYALRLPLFGMSAPLTQHLYIENKIKYLTLFTFVTMVLTIAFTIIMTRYYKLTGAAFSGLPIQILTIFILPLLCREKSLCTIFLHSLVYCPQELFKKLKNLINSTD
jgi:O-antigen/teichoic acid export membrane protein